MSRLIQTESAGKERDRLLKAIVVSLRELMRQTDVNENTRDLSAFISLALFAIDETIERTVAPWEKRDYWIKADRFRRDWVWAGQTGKSLQKALLENDWEKAAAIMAIVAEKVSKIKVSERHRLGTPWVGAWIQLRNEYPDDILSG